MDGVARSPGASALDEGREALRRADWPQAHARFEEALAAGETAEALLGLGIAARGRFDAAGAFEAHERAYRLAREAGDERLAARLALELAIDARVFRGPAEAQGWLERAARLVEHVPPGEEHGMLAYLRASAALDGGHDPVLARSLAAGGCALAQQLGAVEGELVCRALEGLARVAGRAVGEGMRRLDEATAAAVGGALRAPAAPERVLFSSIAGD
jgi:hypothetical protein